MGDYELSRPLEPGHGWCVRLNEKMFESDCANQRRSAGNVHCVECSGMIFWDIVPRLPSSKFRQLGLGPDGFVTIIETSGPDAGNTWLKCADVERLFGKSPVHEAGSFFDLPSEFVKNFAVDLEFFQAPPSLFVNVFGYYIYYYSFDKSFRDKTSEVHNNIIKWVFCVNHRFGSPLPKHGDQSKTAILKQIRKLQSMLSKLQRMLS